MKLQRRLIASIVLAALLPLTAQAQTVLKSHDTHPAGYPTVAAVESMGKKLDAATHGHFVDIRPFA